MIKSILRRTAAILMCIILMVPLFPTAASALSKGTVYVSATTAGVYASKSTSAKKIATVSFGQKIKCTAVSGKWATVKNSAGKTGYMLKSELSDKDANTYKKTVYIQKDGLKVRMNASTGSKTIGKLKLGDDYIAVAKSLNGRWLRIKNGKHYGYVQTVYTDTSPYKKGTKVYMTESRISVTIAPHSWDNIGTINLGQSCTLLEKKNGYAKVRAGNGMVGYINDTSCLSAKNPNTLNKTLYVQANNMAYYPNAMLKNPAGVLNKNAPVKVVAHHSDGWYRVKINGKYYYMDDIVLHESKAPAKGRTYYATSFCKHIYQKPSISAKKIATVKKGDPLILLGRKGSGLKVKNADGIIGYVLSSELSKTPG